MRTKAAKPETLSQARTWESTKNRVMSVGLCERCAAQYAWGAQIGFTHSHPPCEPCAGIIADRPGRERPNGWRTLTRTAAQDTLPGLDAA